MWQVCVEQYWWRYTNQKRFGVGDRAITNFFHQNFSGGYNSTNTAQNVPKLKFHYELVFSAAFLSMMVSDEEQPIMENLCFFCREVPVLRDWLVFSSTMIHQSAELNTSS